MDHEDPQTAVLEAVYAFLRENALVASFVIRIHHQTDRFARFEAVPTDGTADPAVGFAQHLDGAWRVLSLGTYVEADALMDWGVPRSMWPEEALDELRRSGRE